MSPSQLKKNYFAPANTYVYSDTGRLGNHIFSQDGGGHTPLPPLDLRTCDLKKKKKKKKPLSFFILHPLPDHFNSPFLLN